MNTLYTRSNQMTLLLAVCVMSLFAQGCAHNAPRIEPKGFASPNEAVEAMVAAIRADDLQQMRSVLGSDGDEILFSGDDVADAQRRGQFLSLYNEKHSIAADGADKVNLVIGNTDWPFPVPVVRDGNQWCFDAQAGAEEILNRRIGNNELSAIQVCKAIGDAQREYATTDPDKDGLQEYAQKSASDPGKRNGLYWPEVPGEQPSPLGAFAAQASAEGYTRKKEGLTPYHGYYYRILKAQGPHAPGGALDYVVNGRMILGFAVVAFPAAYENSGIMTFIMGADGVVYQKDLGEETAKIAGEMQVFDPDSTWKKVD